MNTRVLWVALTLSAVGSIASCELITKRNGLQCLTTADCRAMGGGFERTICGSSGVCETLQVPEAAPSGACASSEACALSLGAPGRCVGETCVAIPPECTAWGPVSNDSAALVGVLIPKSGPAGVISSGIAFLPDSNLNFVDVELDAILTNWNMVAPMATPPAPLFAAVACDESKLEASLAFLTLLRPTFVLGPLTAAALQTSLTTFPSSVTLFSPWGDDQTFVQSPPQGQNNHWFCSPNRGTGQPGATSPGSVVADFQSAINLVSQFVAAQPGHSSTTKLAIVYDSQEPNENNFLSAVATGTFTFNGENIKTPGAYASEDINIALSQGFGEGVAAGQAVTSFQPDVVVLTGPVWAQPFMDQLETQWAAMNKSLPRPTYLVFKTTDAIAVWAGEQTYSLKNRIFAFDVYRDGALSMNNTMLTGLQSELGTGIDDYVGSPFNDCLYAGMLATTAAGRLAGTSAVNVGARQLYAGVAQVTQGTSTGNLTEAGAQVLLSLLSGLKTGGNADMMVKTELVGTSTYLGLNLTTGAPLLAQPTPSMAVYCVGSSKAPNPSSWNAAGVNYDQSGTPVGAGGDGGSVTLTCP